MPCEDHRVADFKLDTSETPNEEQLGLQGIRLASARLAALEEWWFNNRPDVDRDSQIAAVNALTPYYPLEHQVGDFLSIGLDSLRTAVQVIEKLKEIPIGALYSMIRTAVEVSAYGIWLLSPSKVQKRAFLSLKLTYDNTDNLEGLEKVLVRGTMTLPDRNATRRRLVELQQKLPAYRNHDISAATKISTVVQVADAHVNHRLFSGIQAWKICSGVAHANGLVLRMVLERRPTGERDELGETFVMTSRVMIVASCITSAVESLQALRDLFIAGSAPDSGIRRRRPRK